MILSFHDGLIEKSRFTSKTNCFFYSYTAEQSRHGSTEKIYLSFAYKRFCIYSIYRFKIFMKNGRMCSRTTSSLWCSSRKHVQYLKPNAKYYLMSANYISTAAYFSFQHSTTFYGSFKKFICQSKLID